MSFEEESKEIRSQRHDFIKEYYKMATLDLDRHLKAGWQTIAVLGGGAAILSAGHDGKIGIPIASTIALIAAVWGGLTIIDANFWSLRAIAFLSNVEAIYFSAEDRKIFNPYIGKHPKYKLLDSLNYLFWLCASFGLAVILNLFWTVMNYYPTWSSMVSHIFKMPTEKYLIWFLPLIVALWGSYWTFCAWQTRFADYIKFSEDSPGPGVRKTTELRHVTLEGINGGTAPEIEAREPDDKQNIRAKYVTRKEVRHTFWLLAMFLMSAFGLVLLVKVFPPYPR